MVTRWLITGGCGFIGLALLQRLLRDESNRICIVDNLSTGTRDDLAAVSSYAELAPGEVAASDDRVRLVVADIREPAVADQLAAGIDVIVHLAANTGVGPSVENPRLDCETNVIGSFNYLEAARLNGVERFVFASSGAPVGEVEPPIHEELAPHPVSPYGASKLAGEGYCSAYYRTFGVNTVALRFGNVYGPGSMHKSSVVAKFIRLAMAGETLEIYGDGSQTRDFIYIDDLIEALMLAATQPDVGGEVFQIATSRETTVDEIAHSLVEVLQANGIARPRIVNTEKRLGDVMRNFSDTSKAKTKLGWVPATDLQQGLQKTVDYFKD